MHIDALEKKWAQIALAMCALFISIIMIEALFHNVNAPSNVETVDSASLHLSREFAEDNLGVQADKDGNIIVRMRDRAILQQTEVGESDPDDPDSGVQVQPLHPARRGALRFEE